MLRAKTTMNLIDEILRNKSASTKLYAGLFVTFMNGSNSDLIRQVHVSRRYSLDGLIIFDYAHLSRKYLDVLAESILRPVKQEVCNNNKEEIKEKSKNRGRRNRN